MEEENKNQIIKECLKENLSLREARERFERAFYLEVLEKFHWNERKCADYLKVHRTTFCRKMRRFGIVK